MKKGIFVICVCMALTCRAQFSVYDYMKPAAFTNSAGEVTVYRLGAPQFPEKGKKYPMILFLHGSGECGTNNFKQITVGLPKLFEGVMKRPEPFIIVAPQCDGTNTWVKTLAFDSDYAAPPEPTKALKAALDICDDLIRNRQADPDRFYITGLSLGGFGTWDAIQREPNKFAAAAPICGGGDVRRLAGMDKLPLWIAHGDADKNVPVECSRRMVTAIHDAGNKELVYMEYKDAGHVVWDRVYGDPNFLEWFLTRTRAKKPWWKFW
jgi:predicted peptidase